MTEQELFFEAVAADRIMTKQQKIDALLATCRDYWARLEASEPALERMADQVAALQNDLWATLHGVEPAPSTAAEVKKHDCRTDGCDLGHDTSPLAGPEKPPRCRLDREYGG